MTEIITLEKWALVFNEVDKYTPPELVTCILTGFQETGAALKRINIEQTEIKSFENDIITTEKGQYKLGTVDSEYEKLFPDASERIVKQLLNHFIKKQEKEEFETISIPKSFIPKGGRLVEAYETEKEIIVIGDIDENDESHNCDQMGCSTLSHVKYRFNKVSCEMPF